MSRARTLFTCSECGGQSKTWIGRCPDCGAWASMVEAVEPGSADRARTPEKAAKGAAARTPAQALSEVDRQDVRHVPTGIGELDRCLGGGLVPGSLVLLGGEPGIGKSTLMLQVGSAIARTGRRVLYVSGEESPAQVRLRGERIGACGDASVGASGAGLFVLGETDIDAILAETERVKPAVLIVDSVQVVHDAALTSAPGTVSQVKQAADRFLHLSKERGIATFLVGHVTKEGTLAGPRTLEHVVDTVLSFESEGGHVHRLVRALKNRFGPAGEVGVFEMKGDGLAEVPDASRLFLAERRAGTPGSVVFSSMEGTRPVLVEIQALVAATPYAQPKRMTLGADGNRLVMLLAVLERRAGVRVLDKDVFVNVAGGLRLRETAADLAVAMAVVSALVNIAPPAEIAMFGEVGLAGEIRAVDRAASRLREVRALGFTRCLVARANVAAADIPAGLDIVPVESIAAAIPILFGDLPKRPSRRPQDMPRRGPYSPYGMRTPPGWKDPSLDDDDFLPPDGWGPRPLD